MAKPSKKKNEAEVAPPVLKAVENDGGADEEGADGAKETKGKRKAKGKASSTPTAALTSVAAVVTLSQADADALFVKVTNGTELLKSASMDLAEALWKIQKHEAYRQRGYASFNEYVEKECDLGVRSAYHLIEVYEKFGVSLPKAGRPDALQLAGKIGWSKAKDLVKIINEGNLDEWTETASNTSVKDLAKKVKAALPPKSKPDEPTEIFETLKFKLSAGQLETVQAALQLAQNISQSDKPGHNLALVALAFVETTDPERFAAEGCKKLEELLGLKLIAIDAAKDQIVYGDETLKSLTSGE